MPHTTFLTVRPALAVLAFGALGCGSDLVLPESPSGAAQAVALTKAGGDIQSGPVGEMLASPLIVRVVDGQQHPVSGLSVSFSLSDPAAGALNPPTATTNSAGEAVSNWTLGTVPGAYSVRATLVGVPGEDKIAEFQAVAEPGAPATLVAATPQLQPGSREQKVRTPPVVQVADKFGNSVPDVSVVWQVIAGEGTATPLNVTTDADGKAAADWTLGDRIGVHKLSAAVAGVGAPVVFEARVLF
jgi:hypothetical protein